MKQEIRSRVGTAREKLDDLTYELSWWEVNVPRAQQLGVELESLCKDLVEDLYGC